MLVPDCGQHDSGGRRHCPFSSPGRVAAAVSGLAHRQCAGVADGKPMSFRNMFCNHFPVATVGNFFHPAPFCCVHVERPHEPVTSVSA
jgi:hypothetical protein